MLFRIYANNKSFKSVEFTPGLNVILAEKQANSGKKDSRNGLGKSTFLNVLHFCLGADLKKEMFPIEEMTDWVFSLELALCGAKITASRGISSPGTIRIVGKTESLPIQPNIDGDTLEKSYRIDDWKDLLGRCFFEIPQKVDTKFKPSYRTLISYFIRRGADAYTRPFEYFRNQKAWSTQLHNSYMLGLAWEHASEFQNIKEIETAIKAQQAYLKAGLETKGELEAERLRLQKIVDDESSAISSFKVHPNYFGLQEQANKVTGQIQNLTNDRLIMRRKLDRYEQSVQSEELREGFSVDSVYQEAGIAFPAALKKTLSEAREFHEKIIENRKHFLETEIAEIRISLEKIDDDIRDKSKERDGIMQVLRTHGALDEFNRLQQRSVEKKTELENIKNKIEQFNSVNDQKKQLRLRKVAIESKAERDYEERRTKWEKAVGLFGENCETLYHEGGSLIINATESGYRFNIDIERASSEGVSKMKIFCYDLTLVELWAEKGGIDFLVHDSTLFDPVDSRQKAIALELVASKSLEKNFQYICMLNSDMVPSTDFSEGFSLESYVRLHLNDKDPGGSLLGFKFNLKTRTSSTDEIDAGISFPESEPE